MPSLKFQPNDPIQVVKCSDKRQEQIYRVYEEYIGKKGKIIEFGTSVMNIQGLEPILDKDINLYLVKIDDTNTLIPEDMIEVISNEE